MRLTTAAAGLAVVLLLQQGGCSKPPAPAPASPASEGGPAERQSLTAKACEGQGGKVVGDIGDGAIHRPEYRCPESGAPPIGTIVTEPGAPAPIEGAVCCR